ncbi:MAG: GumC family protein [Thermodesulfobacteriota bacterium]
MTQQNLSSYLQAWKFRKKYFFLSAVPLAIIITVVALRLPPVYESKSTILIEQQQIPPEFVRSTVTGFADEHIQLLTQQILSRPKLWEIVERFDLYAKMRQKVPREEVLEKMRRDIKFKTISAEVSSDKKRGPQSDVTIAFSIAYQGGNPGTVQKVAATLASLYLEQNLKFREAKAQTTTKFLQSELEGLRERIQTLGQKITQYKETHEGILPELQQFNLSQADRLDNEIKQMDNALRAAENQKIYLEGLLGTVDTRSSGTGSMANEPSGRNRSPQERLRSLQDQLTELRAKFADGHPDVQKALREKAQVEKVLKEQASGNPGQRQKLIRLQAELAQKQGVYSDQHPEVQKLKNEIAQLKSEFGKLDPLQTEVDLANPAYVNLVTQLQTTCNQIDSLKKERQNLQEKLKMYRHRLEEAPKVEQEYLALQRDYQNAHAKYQEVMNKLLEARIGEGMEEHQKGEKFTLIDPAEYPETPIKPKRQLIILAGLIMSVVAGLAVMVAAEVVDHSIKTPDELAWLTETAPLGIIANIETTFDLTQKRRRRRLLLIATCCSVPLALLMVHFFFMDLWIMVAKLLRLSSKIS